VTIPDYQTLMLPVLKLASDGKEHKFSQAVEQPGVEFDLTSDEAGSSAEAVTVSGPSQTPEDALATVGYYELKKLDSDYFVEE